jgi:hypothetical protein
MPKGFPDATTLDGLFRCDVKQLIACFRSMRAAIHNYASVRRMAMSVIAVHVAANIIDFYITKYAAKPMEQLQNLVTQYALGLRRLELEEAEADNTTEVTEQARGRRVLLRLQYAANRSKWISSTECALYVHTEQQHWTSHNELPMFISRALYLVFECKRILSDSKVFVTRADTGTQFAVVSYDCILGSTQNTKTGDTTNLAPLPLVGLTNNGEGAHLARDLDRGEPVGLPNIDNTCFMNALLQSLRQVLLRTPSGVLPKSQHCPLALPLQPQAFSADEISQWQCWLYLPPGIQRDACHVLEMCLGCEGSMHSQCLAGDCYGELLRNITSFDLTRETICGRCEFANQEAKSQCVLHVEPNTSIESAMRASLAVFDIDDHKCEACLCKNTRQQTRLGDLPEFLVVHVNKHAHFMDQKTEANVRLSGKELRRVAVLHHTGGSTEAGHYTCTLTTEGGQTYHCNDDMVSAKPHHSELAWDNSYLVFLQVMPQADAQHAEDVSVADGIRISDAHPPEDDMEVDNDCGDAWKLFYPAENDKERASGSGDAHPPHNRDDDDEDDDDEDDDDEDDDDGGDEDKEEGSPGDARSATGDKAKQPEYTVQATECRVTSTRHDDWLHRGPFLADLPWHVYMRRVQRTRKPSKTNADYSQIFFFDRHYALSSLYCQEIRYAQTTTIPRLVGSVCPPEEEDDGEPHAAYKLMLFSRARCPGPEHCADPLTFRPLMIPSDSPEHEQTRKEKPRFKPCWNMCKCELELKATIASVKERRAEKIAVIADTTIMKELKESNGDTHPAAGRGAAYDVALRLRPHLLQLFAGIFNKHTERMPQGIVELVDRISYQLCGVSLYSAEEQLHLSEFAALEATTVNRNIDKDILVRKKQG